MYVPTISNMKTMWRFRFYKIFKKKVQTAEDEDIEMKMKKTVVTLKTILSLR